MRVLLVGVDRAGQPVLGAARVVGLHPLARGLRRLRGHVLTGGVAGGEVDPQVEQRTDLVLADVGELARARGRLGDGADLVLVPIDPVAELARLHGVVEDEHRRALHAVLDDGRLDAAALAEHAHPAVVAGDERALGGRQRHVEVSLRVLAVDAQRTGHADRHLRHAGEVLDVPRQHAGIEREASDVLEVCPGLLAQELTALGRHLGRVVVRAVARDARGGEGRHFGRVIVFRVAQDAQGISAHARSTPRHRHPCAGAQICRAPRGADPRAAKVDGASARSSNEHR